MALWSYKETSCLQEEHAQPLYCASFNHHSRHLEDIFVTVGSNRATVYRCSSNGELEVLQVYVDGNTAEEYYASRWTVDSTTTAPLLLLAGKNALLHVINCATATLEMSLEGHGRAINDVAVHPTRPELVATASKDHSLRLWNIKTKVCVLVFVGAGSHRSEVLSLDWSTGRGEQEGPLLVSAGMDNYIMVWSLQNHVQLLDESSTWKPNCRAFPTRHVTVPHFATERVHWNYVDCVRWLGDMILSKSVDNRIILWRPIYSPSHLEKGEDFEFIQELSLEDTKDVWWLRFCLDLGRQVLAVGTATGKVLLFDPHTQQMKPMARLKRSGKKPEKLVRQTAMSADGSIIIAAHEDGSITRYDRTSNASK